ncbi:MAG: zinc metallopeptidase [Planctomycetia bacterium]|nr:zinc metallopeptidase [Planctomycetia bacterium]
MFTGIPIFSFIVLDPLYFILVGPFLLLGLLAQVWVKSAFMSGQSHPTSISGAQAARRILDNAGLMDVAIEQVEGTLSDHYDPSARVLRLSPEVYHGFTASAVGVAAHEAGHALQHAHKYAPLTIRNLVVPLAGFGSGAGIWMFILGILFSFPPLILAGIVLFSAVVFFQIINLPVEFNASTRAKAELANMGIFTSDALGSVNRVLRAAAMTYVAATLQSIMTLVYLLLPRGE